MKNEEFQQLIESAITDLQQNDFAAGDIKLQQILQQDSRNPDPTALQVFIKSKVLQCQLEQVPILLTPLLEKPENHVRFLFYLADVFIKHKNYPLTNKICSAVYNIAEDASTVITCAKFFVATAEYNKAIACYQRLLARGYAAKADIYVAMSAVYNLMRQHDKVEESLQEALLLSPNHKAALFNLATHLEESGCLDRATSVYQQLLCAEPDHAFVLNRLIYIKKINSDSLYLLDAAKMVLKKNVTELDRETLLYSLGKGHDDLCEYEMAFKFYREANLLSEKRLPAYDHARTELLTRKIVQRSSAGTLLSVDSLDICNIFICGMFRSGTTLVEQLLASSEDLFAAGEVVFVDTLISEYFPNYPECEISDSALVAFRQSYNNKVKQLAPNAKFITNKMPDNFWHVEILTAAFPDSKFIFTDRHPLDISLSIYFQQLGSRLSYNSSIAQILQFYAQFKLLLKHWQACFPGIIHVFHYDDFIEAPDSAAFDLYKFCRLPWNPESINFYKLKNNVKTASVWQVRQPVFKTSSGRYRNYLPQLREVVGEEILAKFT